VRSDENWPVNTNFRYWPDPAVGRILHVPAVPRLAAAPIGRPAALADESAMAR